MTLRTIVLALISLSLFFAPTARGEHYDVFILAGQSNMDGRGRASDLVGDLAKYAKPREDVHIAYSNSGIKGPHVESDGFQPLQPGWSSKSGAKVPGDAFGPEVGFGHAMADHFPQRHIALIKFAQGGTNLHTQWNPDKTDQIYARFIPYVKQSLERLTRNGDTCTLRGMCWHQGESDAGGAPGAYQANLTHFIERVRIDLDAPELPFAIGEICTEQPGKKNLAAEQKATSQAVAHAPFVSAQGLKTSDRGTHFDAASQIELGRRFAEAMIPVMKDADAKK